MVETEQKKKEYDYDKIFISLENCILPIENIDETPSMKDGLDRDTENDLRMYGCEMIQTAGILLKVPQVAMATGQVIFQRFYFSKSMVKHDVEATAMAAIFLAAKIEESSRRLRDVINVCQHIKQRIIQKPHAPMDYFSQTYFNLKNGVIKAERRILKDLGFCVHVKHPHKLIITYLQLLEHEKNQTLARKAWNYMNDSLRSDVFVRFPPETIACACIFLAARTEKINLPLRPPWYELFDATYDDIEDISITILRLYTKPRRKLLELESVVSKLKKEKAEKEKTAALKNEEQKKVGSFTPSQNDDTSQPVQNTTALALNNNITKADSKPSSRTASPLEKNLKDTTTTITIKNGSSDLKKSKRRRHSESEHSSYSSSDSEADLPSKKYSKQKKNYEEKRNRKRSPSSDSDNDYRGRKARRSVSPDERRSKLHKDSSRSKLKDTNGHDKSHSRSKRRSRSRSRSPVKRRSPSPSSRKDKYKRERERDRIRSKDKYSSKSRR